MQVTGWQIGGSNTACLQRGYALGSLRRAVFDMGNSVVVQGVGFWMLWLNSAFRTTSAVSP